MITLLAIKAGDDYFRFKDDRYHSCPFSKASVFPVDQVDKVKAHLSILKNDGIVEPLIVQLTITEKPYT